MAVGFKGSRILCLCCGIAWWVGGGSAYFVVVIRFLALQSVPFGMLDVLRNHEREQLDETFPGQAKGHGFSF